MRTECIYKILHHVDHSSLYLFLANEPQSNDLLSIPHVHFIIGGFER